MAWKQLSAVLLACYITRDAVEKLVTAYLMSAITCVSCLFHQRSSPFANTTMMDERSVCINDSTVGETTDLNAFEAARSQQENILVTYS